MASKLCTLVFLLEGDNILLAMKKRGFGAGLWNGIGGKVGQGETIHDALIREAEEEIIVTPQEYEAAGILEFSYPGKGIDMVVHVFICTSWDGEPLESEEMAPRWFKLSDIPYDHMWPDDPYWLPQVLEGQFIRGKFLFDEHENMLSHDVREV